MGIRVTAFLLFLSSLIVTESSVYGQNLLPSTAGKVVADADSTLVYSYLNQATKAHREGDIRKQRKILVFSWPKSLQKDNMAKFILKALRERELPFFVSLPKGVINSK